MGEVTEDYTFLKQQGRIEDIDEILDFVEMLLQCNNREEIERLGDSLLSMGRFNQAAALAYCFEKGILVEMDLNASADLWRFAGNSCGNNEFSERSRLVRKMADRAVQEDEEATYRG